MKRLLTLTVVMALVLMGGSAFALTDTETLSVSATSSDVCRFTSGGTMTFSTDYDPTDPVANESGEATFEYKCSKGVVYRLYIGADRTMVSGTESLPYGLYTDAGRTTEYPSTFATATDNTSASNTTQTETVYGQIPAGADVTGGLAFTNSVTLTVEW